MVVPGFYNIMQLLNKGIVGLTHLFIIFNKNIIKMTRVHLKLRIMLRMLILLRLSVYNINLVQLIKNCPKNKVMHWKVNNYKLH